MKIVGRNFCEIDPNGEFCWGLNGYLWQSSNYQIIKVHRYNERFQREVETYERVQERGIERLKGFRFPQLIHCDQELRILELSFVSPPFILDFVEVGFGKGRQTSIWTASKFSNQSSAAQTGLM